MVPTTAIACEAGWEPHADVIAKLRTQYKEDRKAVAIAAPGVFHATTIAELFTNSESWTIIIQRPDGCSTMLVHGWDWRDLPKGRPM